MKKILPIIIAIILLAGVGFVAFYLINKAKDNKVVEEESDAIPISDIEYESYEDLLRILCGNGTSKDLINITSLNVGDEIKKGSLEDDVILKSSIRYLVEKDILEITESTNASSKYADVIEYQIKLEDIKNAGNNLFNKEVDNYPLEIIDNEYEYLLQDNLYIGRLLNTNYTPDTYEYSVNNVRKNNDIYIINIFAIKRDDTQINCESDDCDIILSEPLQFELEYKLDNEIYSFIRIKRVK